MTLNVVMTPVGSAGDVHPFLHVGRTLRARGHDVTVITAEPFRAAARAAGLGFVAFPPTEVFEAAVADPDLWHPTRGFRVVMEHLARSHAGLYAHVAAHDAPGRTVLVGHSIAFATRVHEEVNATPAITLHLAPSVFRSRHAQPVLSDGRDLSRWPRIAKRAAWWAIDRLVLDPAVLPALNAFRATHGLAPVRRCFAGWIHSPNAVAGLFPDWFAPPQPDWPARTTLVGFPLDDASDAPLDPALDAFLDAGAPPLVFTPGSANSQARRFLEAGAGAAARLGRRALLLTRYREQVPDPLPEGVRHVEWAPLGALLPRCAAIAHHGGIGTAASGLAAGVPQVIMPMGFDQPDNAARLERLGVGRSIPPSRFEPERVAATLAGLLGSRDAARACRRWREATLAGRGVALAADAVESAYRTGARRASPST